MARSVVRGLDRVRDKERFCEMAAVQAVERFCRSSHGSETPSPFQADKSWNYDSVSRGNAVRMFSCFPLSGVSARCVFSRMAFPAYRFLFCDVNSAEGSRRFDKTNSKSLTPLHPQLQIDHFVVGPKASQKSVLVADEDFPPSPSPSPSLSLVSNMRPKRTFVSGASRVRKKHPAMKVRCLLTAVTNVAQRATPCLEAMKSSEWRAGLSDDGTHLFLRLNQSCCRNRGAGRRANVERYIHPAINQGGQSRAQERRTHEFGVLRHNSHGQLGYDIAAPES